MTEDVSDNFSIDSLEEDGKETNINLPVSENQTLAIEVGLEVSEVIEINDSGTTSDGKSSNHKPCTFYVPFYSGNTHVSDIHKIKKFNIRPRCYSKETSKLVLPEEAVKKCQKINVFTESCQRVERWRTNVQSSKKIVLSESNRKKVDNFYVRKERSQSLIPITRSMANMKLYEHAKRPSKSFSGESLQSLSTGFCCSAAVTKQNILLQNKKCVSYLDQYRLKKYGKHYDKCQRSTSTELESTFLTENSLTDSVSTLQRINANREYSEDFGVSYMQMIDDGLDLENVNESTYSDQYKTERNCELDTTLGGGHMSSDQMCTKSQTKLENDEKRNAHKFATYTIDDYRLLLPTKLGKLGPDVAANKEKVDQLLKRLEYGDLASRRNRELIRLKNMKEEKIAISKSTLDVTNSSPESKKHGDKKSLLLKSQEKHGDPKNRTRKSDLNMKLAVASSSKPEPKETVVSRNARSTTNDSQTGKKKEIKSNKEMIMKMQERHRKEIEIIENI